MSLSKRIDDEYIIAYKAKDQQRLDVLRLLKTAAKNQQVSLRRPITDDELLDVIQKQAKQRQDSIEQFSSANRQDLADKEQAELIILQDYLPTPLTEQELDAAIAQAIADCKADSLKNMGTVIAQLMNNYKGRIDGKKVSEKVRACLAG